jgi:hypothetical protein
VNNKRASYVTCKTVVHATQIAAKNVPAADAAIWQKLNKHDMQCTNLSRTKKQQLDFGALVSQHARCINVDGHDDPFKPGDSFSTPHTTSTLVRTISFHVSCDDC